MWLLLIALSVTSPSRAGPAHGKLVFVGTPLVAALIGYSTNLFLLQEPVNDILKESKAFNGMEVSAHYQYWVVPGVVVYDLQGLSRTRFRTR